MSLLIAPTPHFHLSDLSRPHMDADIPEVMLGSETELPTYMESFEARMVQILRSQPLYMPVIEDDGFV